MAIWLIVGLSIVCVWIWCFLFILEYRISKHEQKLSSGYMVNTQNVNDSIKRVRKRASSIPHCNVLLQAETEISSI